MAESAILDPPFARGPLSVERVTAKNGRSVLQVPFVRVTMAGGAEIHLTERQAAGFGRQLLAACIPPAPDRLPDIRAPKTRAEETEPRRA
jgi:hypothetical protein